MRFFNRGYPAEPPGQRGETFFFRVFGEPLIHIGPLIVFAFGGVKEVIRGFAQVAQLLKPEAGMLLLVARGLEEQRRNLLVSLFLRDRGKIGVLVPGLALSGKCVHQILFGLGSGILVSHVFFLLCFLYVVFFCLCRSFLLKQCQQAFDRLDRKSLRPGRLFQRTQQRVRVLTLRQHIPGFAEQILCHQPV